MGMLVLKMWPWVSFTMVMILYSTLSLNAEANQAMLVGTVYCDTCFHQHFSPSSSHFISGALVAVACGGGETQESGKRPRFREEVKTDMKGEFRVLLPFSATKHDLVKGCSVKLISSSEPDCAVAAISSATSSSIRVKAKTHENHVFSAGFFSFQPLEQPKLCDDEIVALTPFPSPIYELHDYDSSFGSSLPVNQPPPVSNFIPVPVVPSPPDSGLQPPPDSIINTGFQPPPDSMINTGAQPPPDSDSMFNTGFQPPPDTTFNTGLQPPPDSTDNTAFQPPPDSTSTSNAGFQSPPPDSMFDPNPSAQPPPDTTTDPSQPSPPSVAPQLLTPPPSSQSQSPSPPSSSSSLPPPDLIEATPPPPFNPPFPAFPFQPSAGLPRMPPETRKPPVLYKQNKSPKKQRSVS